MCLPPAQRAARKPGTQARKRRDAQGALESPPTAYEALIHRNLSEFSRKVFGKLPLLDQRCFYYSPRQGKNSREQDLGIN